MSKSANSEKSKRLAAYLREHGVCRTTGRCANCYQIITIESWKSKYRHVCK